MMQKKIKDTKNVENEGAEVEVEEEKEIKKTPARPSATSASRAGNASAVADAGGENKEQEYLEGWKRCMADFDNYKKRQTESQKYIGEYVKEDFVLQILPVVDNFRSATEHIPFEQKDSPWVAGIMHIQKQLENILRDNGVDEIEVKIGDEFEPSLHEAVANNQEEEKKENKNKIKKVVLKGYRIGEKVIRVARVVVG